MKIKQLIEELQKYPEDMEVLLDKDYGSIIENLFDVVKAKVKYRPNSDVYDYPRDYITYNHPAEDKEVIILT